MSLFKELLQLDPSIAENNGKTRFEYPSAPKIECPPGFMKQIKDANFLDEMTDDREKSRFFINGGPDHIFTVKQLRGIMGESVHVFASGPEGPTVISVAEKKDFKGKIEPVIDEIWLNGERGSSMDDALEAVRLLDDVFPDYSLVQEVVVDSSGNKYINGELQTYEKPAVELASGAESVIAS